MLGYSTEESEGRSLKLCCWMALVVTMVMQFWLDQKSEIRVLGFPLVAWPFSESKKK